jgi:hypothetical protein
MFLRLASTKGFCAQKILALEQAPESRAKSLCNSCRFSKEIEAGSPVNFIQTFCFFTPVVLEQYGNSDKFRKMNSNRGFSMPEEIKLRIFNVRPVETQKA